MAGPSSHEQEALRAFVLRTRALNALRSAGILTVGQLAALSERALLAIPGVGIKSVADLSRALAERGLAARAGEPLSRLALPRPSSRRDHEIARMRATGASLAEVARRFAISSERVRQLLERDRPIPARFAAEPALTVGAQTAKRSRIPAPARTARSARAAPRTTS